MRVGIQLTSNPQKYEFLLSLIQSELSNKINKLIFYPSVSGLGNSGLSLHSGILSSQGRLSSKPHDNVMKIERRK